jgi:hypothetical protein
MSLISAGSISLDSTFNKACILRQTCLGRESHRRRALYQRAIQTAYTSDYSKTATVCKVTCRLFLRWLPIYSVTYLTSTGGGHSTKELSRQLTRLTILKQLRYESSRLFLRWPTYSLTYQTRTRKGMGFENIVRMKV